MLANGFEGWPQRPLHLAIGAFDGVHRGHRELVRRLREGASREAALAVAATFDPLPAQVLAPNAPPSALTNADERAELLAAAGAEAVVVFRFDASLVAMSAREFAERVFAAGDVRRVVVGPDFRFGHGREGDVAMLAGIAAEHGSAVDVVRPLELSGGIVSSTRIRDLLVAGDVRAAATLLGRPYSIAGRVAGRDGSGRGLGDPTVVVMTPPERLLPADGIYATWVTLGGGRHAAVTSVARSTSRPGSPVLECRVLDVGGELHGEDATTTFVERLRDDRRAGSDDALVAQMAEDVGHARAILHGWSAGG